ncbi:MAG: TIGR02117 family protein [Hyphomicrobiales bacterium]|nr:TIGR02117 family protein [Hyphomicrobiales bacterium]
MVRRILRLTLFGFAAVFVVGAVYLLAAFIGTIWRPGGGALAGEDRRPVIIVWSEIHTDIILPADGRAVNWKEVLGSDAGSLAMVDYFAFGWGSESFYKDVPTTADITPGVIATAMFFDRTVVHVSPVADPARIPSNQRITLWVSEAGLRELESHVLESLALDDTGRAIVLPGETYGYGDAFYQAHGRYSPIRTCNQWTSEGLRRAGVSAGYWTPFAQSITWTLGSDADQAAALN